MGTRADAPNPQMDAKPYAGGNPHCFPQFGPGELMQVCVCMRLCISIISISIRLKWVMIIYISL